MKLSEYQQSIRQFVRYDATVERPYLALGLVSEVGEVAGKFAKRYRGDSVPDADVIAELSDVLWFTRMIRNHYHTTAEASTHVILIRHADDAIAKLFDFARQIYDDMQRDTVSPVYLCMIEDVIKYLAGLHGCKTLDALADVNYAKLSGRAERGVIVGSGDAR